MVIASRLILKDCAMQLRRSIRRTEQKHAAFYTIRRSHQYTLSRINLPITFLILFFSLSSFLSYIIDNVRVNNIFYS